MNGVVENGGTPLVLTASSLGCPPWRELLAATAEAGFSGLSIWPGPTYYAAREAGWSDADLRSSLAVHGLVVHDVDAYIVWAGPDDPGPPYIEETLRDEVLRAGEVLGATVANVVVCGEPPVEEAAIVESVAGAAERLNAAGLAVVVEFTGRSALRDLATTVRIVEQVRAAGHDVSALLDVWHHRWSGARGGPIPAAQATLVRQVQLNDAPAVEPVDRAWANRHERLVPGEGACDVPGLARSVLAANPAAVMTLEVFHDRLLGELGVRGMARHLARAGRLVVDGLYPVDDRAG